MFCRKRIKVRNINPSKTNFKSHLSEYFAFHQYFKTKPHGLNNQIKTAFCDSFVRKFDTAIKAIRPNANVCKEVENLPMSDTNIFSKAYNALGSVNLALDFSFFFLHLFNTLQLHSLYYHYKTLKTPKKKKGPAKN